jgi:hypothetical protein
VVGKLVESSWTGSWRGVAIFLENTGLYLLTGIWVGLLFRFSWYAMALEADVILVAAPVAIFGDWLLWRHGHGYWGPASVLRLVGAWAFYQGFCYLALGAALGYLLL